MLNQALKFAVDWKNLLVCRLSTCSYASESSYILVSKFMRTRFLVGGGYLNYILTECATLSLKPYPLSYGFFSRKKTKQNKTRLIWLFFFTIFVKWDPLLRIFLNQIGHMSKDFFWKSNPLGRHIPVCLNMWVPPPPVSLPKLGLCKQVFKLFLSFPLHE